MYIGKACETLRPTTLIKNNMLMVVLHIKIHRYFKDLLESVGAKSLMMFTVNTANDLSFSLYILYISLYICIIYITCIIYICYIDYTLYGVYLSLTYFTKHNAL